MRVVVVVVVGLRFQKGSKWFVEVAPVVVVCFQTSLQRIAVDYCRTSLRRCVEVMSRSASEVVESFGLEKQLSGAARKSRRR